MLKRIITLLPLLVLAATAAHAAQYVMQCPPGWTDERSSLGDDLEKQCISPNQDAFVELYVAPGDNIGLENMMNEWTQALLAKGMPFQNNLGQNRGKVSGVDALVREFSGSADGTRIHSYVAVMHNQGTNYVVQGLYMEERAAALKPQVSQCMDTFRFVGGGSMGQPYAQPQPQPQPYGQQGQGGQYGQQGQAGAGGLSDRAWKTGGDGVVQWGMAKGSVQPGGPFSVWELTTTKNVGLHFRDATRTGKQQYHVDIADKATGQKVWGGTVGMFEKVRVGPGHFQITVRWGGGPAQWQCDWE